MKPPTEAAVLRACLEYLKLRGILAWRSSNHAARRRDKAGREFWAFHGLKGMADIIGILPMEERGPLFGPLRRRYGVLLACECKAPGKKPTQAQAAFLAAVEAAGGVGCWVSDVNELAAILDDWGA